MTQSKTKKKPIKPVKEQLTVSDVEYIVNHRDLDASVLAIDVGKSTATVQKFIDEMPKPKNRQGVKDHIYVINGRKDESDTAIGKFARRSGSVVSTQAASESGDRDKN